MKKLLSAIALISATAAQAFPVNTEGGSGTPVTVTLDRKVDYTIARGYSNMRIAFLLAGGGITNFLGGLTAADVTLYFTINDDPTHRSLSDSFSTSWGPSPYTTPSIVFTSVAPVTIKVGDVVTLWGGLATTLTSVSGTAPGELDLVTAIFPIDGSYPAAETGTYSAVPEPSAFAALSGLATLALAATRRRSR